MYLLTNTANDREELLSCVFYEQGKKVGSNIDCLLTNLFIENRKGLVAISRENKIQLQKIHDTKPDRGNE